MKRWSDMDLESPTFQFKELSGSTSINLKIRKADATDPQGYKSWGSFVPRNGAANPDTEIAYFNLAAILGWDSIFRPCARYELGPTASSTFKGLIANTSIHGSDRLENKARILKEIASGHPLRGCVKAKKLDSSRTYDEITQANAPRSSHPIIISLQASNAMPKTGDMLDLGHGYKGDALQLAREYSVIMTLDAIFEQWDRYSGGNVVIAKDESGLAQFYATDNGGADVGGTTNWAEHHLRWFSRFDRSVVDSLRELNIFLKGGASAGYLGYTDPAAFVVDLGLYRELSASVYVTRLIRDLDLLLASVKASEDKHGTIAYLS
jgi:hypothetical protein